MTDKAKVKLHDDYIDNYDCCIVASRENDGKVTVHRTFLSHIAFLVNSSPDVTTVVASNGNMTINLPARTIADAIGKLNRGLDLTHSPKRS